MRALWGVVWLLACEGGGTAQPDSHFEASVLDARVADASRRDAVVGDAARPDAAPPDAWPLDAAPPDAGQPDAGHALRDALAPPDAGPDAAVPVPVVVPCEASCARVQACDLVPNFDAAACVRDCQAQPPARAAEQVGCVLAAPACEGSFGDHVVDFCPDDARPGRACLGFCVARTACLGEGDPAVLAGCLTACGAGFGGDEGLAFAASAQCLDRTDPFDCAGVSACIPADVHPDCAHLCGQLAACDATPPGCAAACAQDPLGRLRSLQGAVCADPECDALQVCVRQSLNPGEVPTAAAFCAQWAACGLEGDCAQAFQQLALGGPEQLRCAGRQLALCPLRAADLFDTCLGGGPPADPTCEALCEARGVCGLDDNPRACLRTCAADDEAGRFAAQRPCASAFSCVALEACVEAHLPSALCAEACAVRRGCDPNLDRIACEVQCDRAFTGPGAAAERACLASAADCDAVALCVADAAGLCPAACDRLAACGRGSADCLADCQGRTPAASARFSTCALIEPCRDVGGCASDDAPSGRLCVNACRAFSGCAPDQAAPACLQRCVAGLGGQAALQVAQGSDCLLTHEACADLGGCVAAPVAVSCAADCAELSRCGAHVPDCLAECRAAPDLVRAGCLADSARLGRGCGGVLACVGEAPPAVAPECAALCAARDRCEVVDPVLCARACGPAAAVQRACVEASPCRDLAACLALDETPAAVCDAPCQTAVGCGAFPDAATCAATCKGRLFSPSAPADYLPALPPCLATCEPDAARACFDFPPADCVAACRAQRDCLAPDPDCVPFCEQDLLADPAAGARRIQCFVDHLGGGRCDVEAAFACIGG